MTEVLKTFVAVMRAISESPNPRASAHQLADQTALQVFDASRRPLVAALLTIAVCIKEGRNV